MNTPISDRAKFHANECGTSHVVPIETARALERIAGELYEALTMADGTPLLDYLERAFPANNKTDEWTSGYEENKRRIFKIIAPKLRPALARYQAMKDEATK